MGKIADILQARGQLDEALRIHEEELLPVAEQLKDVDALIHSRAMTAQYRLSSENPEPEEIRRAMTDLSQAHKLAKEYGRLDFICMTGFLLGRVLLAVGGREHAIPMLTEARAGFIQLEQPHMAEQIDRLLELSGDQ